MEHFLTAREVGKALGMSKNNVYLLVHRGLLPAVKVGRQYRWPQSKFEAWLSAKWAESPASNPAKSTLD